LRNAVTKNAKPASDALCRNPITGIAGCCARGKRPCGRAAEQRDELAPFQLSELHSAAAAKTGFAGYRIGRD
jgi:hypothetical protein